MTAPDAAPPRRTLAFLARRLRPEAAAVAALALLLFAAIGLQLSAPQALRAFIDGVTRTALPLPRLWTLAALFLALTAAGQAARIASTWLSAGIGWRTTNRLRAELARHVLGLDLAFHHARTPGELIERLDGDVTVLAGVFADFVVQILGGAVLVSAAVALVALQDWRIGLALADFAALALVFLHATRDLSVPPAAAERQARADLAGFLEERIGGLDDIRANGGGAHVMAGLARLTAELNRRGLATDRAGRAVWVTTAALFVLSSLIALTGGVWLFQRGEASVGTVYLIVQYAAMMRDPLNQVGTQLQLVQRAAASLQRINALLALEPTLRDGPGARWPPGPTAVDFTGVTFAYNADTPVLRDVSFRLGAGQTLGLLGRSGAGKSTLIRLLARLHDPTSGAIGIGGVDLRQASLAQLRERIGVVTQDVQVFEASVRDNVTLFDERIGEARIAATLEGLGLGAWLARHGLDGRLHPGSLSAGEAQLLAFARVFLRDPALVILDEASSRLDPQTDRLVERAVDALLRPPGRAARTAVIIAHKLATVRRADRIVVLEAGRIVEDGERTALAADPASRLSRLLAAARDGVLA